MLRLFWPRQGLLSIRTADASSPDFVFQNTGAYLTKIMAFALFWSFWPFWDVLCTSWIFFFVHAGTSFTQAKVFDHAGASFVHAGAALSKLRPSFCLCGDFLDPSLDFCLFWGFSAHAEDFFVQVGALLPKLGLLFKSLLLYLPLLRLLHKLCLSGGFFFPG